MSGQRGRGRALPTKTPQASAGRGRGRGLPVAQSVGVGAGPSGIPPQLPPSAVFDVKELETSMFTPAPLPRRPGPGTRGQVINLVSNMFELDLGKSTWYRYDVDIALEGKTIVAEGAQEKIRYSLQTRKNNRAIIKTLFDQHLFKRYDRCFAYDGRKNFLYPVKLEEQPGTYTISHKPEGCSREKKYVVKLQFVHSINVGTVKDFYTNPSKRGFLDPEVLQCINIVIDSVLGEIFTAVGRCYFNGSRPLSLGEGVESRSGFYTSAIFTDWKPLLIVDQSWTAFTEAGPMIDFIRKSVRGFEPNAGLNPKYTATISKLIKGLVVKLSHSQYGRSVKCHGLSDKPANQIRFRTEDNREITVSDYFKNNYRPLRYPGLPCVTVSRANGTKTEYFPVEVCEIKPNQPHRKKLTPNQTATMIRSTTLKPDERLKAAVKNAETILDVATVTMRDFGVSVSSEPVKTTGRKIVSPNMALDSAGGRNVNVSPEGKWLADRYHTHASLTQWVVVDCAGCGPRANKVANDFFEGGRRLKFQHLRQASDVLHAPQHVNSEGVLNQVLKFQKDKNSPILALIILSSFPDALVVYSEIKRLSETDPKYKSIITQCLKDKNVKDERKFSRQFVNNVLNKINAKLGGTNASTVQRPKLLDGNVLVLGADVSHAGVGDTMTPSIAAIVGSLDSIPSKYHTEIRVQVNENTNRYEYIKDLKNVAVTMLKNNYIANGKIKPQRIIYLRDGVSDGQFDEVREREIKALREACLSLEKTYQPSMIAVVAQKRHHVRFKAENSRAFGTTSNGNILPGTYIDRNVVHPTNHDFYMYSHTGIGTTRPTHYQVIHSDEPITTDDLTELLFHLCHCYARTSFTVSIPAPIYYAHLAAFRAKEHVKGDPKLNSCGSTVSSGLTPIQLEKYIEACGVTDEYKNRLYYV